MDSPFNDEGGLQASRVYVLDPATAALTLAGDLGTVHTPVLGLAAASATELYAVGSDTVDDADGVCFSCVLLHVVLDPGSATPASLVAVGRVQSGGVTVEGITGLTFRSDGTLWASSEQTDSLYRVDRETAALTLVGPITIDPGGGCGTDVLNVIGGDLTFDDLDRLWLWSNTPGPDKGIWEVNPSNGCAVQSGSCQASRNMAGMAVIGHLDAATDLRAVSPNDERLYRVVPGSCPADGGPGSLVMTLGGEAFNLDRGDLDSPFCENDAACDDGDACTTETCTAGGCQGVSVVCDDGNPCTTDTCAPSSGCLFESVGPPSEVAGVQLSRIPGVTAVSWTPQPAPFSYDLASGSLTTLRIDGSVVQAVCLGNSGAPPFQDAGPDPTPGQGFYYLVRAHGACGTGSYGVASSGAERVPAAPCP